MVVGLRRFSRRMRKIAKDTRSASLSGLKEAAELINDEQERLVPQDELDLLASIGNEETPNRKNPSVTMFAGSSDTVVKGKGRSFQNAFLQEFGTVDMPPSPFFFPAYRSKKRAAKSRVTRRIKNAIRNS